eukprot:gene880-633_t
MVWTPDAQTYSVFTTLGFNAVLGFAVMIIFEYFRVRQLDIYTPNLRKDAEEEIPVPTRTVFGWIPKLWALSDDDMLKIAGLDAYVYLRFIKMMFQIGITCCAGLVILFPVYVTAMGNKGVEGINKYSMGNIEQKGDRLWASTAMAYVFTIVFLVHIHREYENFAKARTLFFNGIDKTLPPQMSYTVIVENIPPEYRTSEKLREFFDSLFPGEVLHASMAVHLEALNELVEERHSLLIKLEQAHAEWEASGRKTRPKVAKKSWYSFVCGATNKESAADATTDAIDFYSDQIAIVSEQIFQLQQEATNVSTSGNSIFSRASNIVPEFLSESARALTGRISNVTSTVTSTVDNKLKTLVKDTKLNQLNNIVGDIDLNIVEKMVSGSALVTFRSRRTAAVAAQIPILAEHASAVKVQPAPAPSDIVWANMDASTEHTEGVAFLTSLMYYGGLLFWSIVLTFISLISNLSYLQKYLPFLKSLDTTSYAFLQGILPVVVMLVFLSLVPAVMAFVAERVERRKTSSAIQLEVFRWYFLYQISNVYLLLIAGSTITSISDVINNPTAILEYVSSSLPTTSVFFINYIITTTFSGVPLNIVNIGPFLYYAFVRYFVPEKYLTRRTLFEGPLASSTMAYGTALPSELYLVCIMLLYWIIAPFLLLVSTIYFGANYVALKYNFVYVMTRSYESGGQFWYGLYDNSMFALLVSSVTFLVYVSIKEGTFQAPALVPLPVLVIFAWRYTEQRFKQWSLNVPYSTAVRADLDSHHEEVLETFSEDFIKHPNLLVPRTVYPYPYRLDGHPQLISAEGLVDAVYLEEIPAGEEANAHVSSKKEQIMQQHARSTIVARHTLDEGSDGGRASRASASASSASFLSNIRQHLLLGGRGGGGGGSQGYHSNGHHDATGSEVSSMTGGVSLQQVDDLEAAAFDRKGSKSKSNSRAVSTSSSSASPMHPHPATADEQRDDDADIESSAPSVSTGDTTDKRKKKRSLGLKRMFTGKKKETA